MTVFVEQLLAKPVGLLTMRLIMLFISVSGSVAELAGEGSVNHVAIPSSLLFTISSYYIGQFL